MITIEQVTNGVVIIHPHPTEDCMVKTVVANEDHKNESVFIEKVTYELWEILGYLPTKHDKERLFLERRKQ